MVERVNTAYHSPRTPVRVAWGTNGTAYVGTGGTNPISVTSQDPNSNSFPVWYATGRAGIDGNFTIALKAGFTAPVNLVVWEYNRVAQAWFKLGAAAAQYQTTCDATFVQNTFPVSENAYVLIQSNNPITGAIYMDGVDDFAGGVGAPQEGF